MYHVEMLGVAWLQGYTEVIYQHMWGCAHNTYLHNQLTSVLVGCYLANKCFTGKLLATGWEWMVIG